jgi:hypothetical protein
MHNTVFAYDEDQNLSVGKLNASAPPIKRFSYAAQTMKRSVLGRLQKYSAPSVPIQLPRFFSDTEVWKLDLRLSTQSSATQLRRPSNKSATIKCYYVER